MVVARREGASGSAGRTESTSISRTPCVGRVVFVGLVADPGPEENRMRQLPDRPHLDQLRHQARELQRSAGRGDPDAVRRLAAAARGATLGAAQLAIAREYGFASWERLKSEVERRAADAAEDAAPRWVIRPVSSRLELAAAFDVMGAQMTPRITHDDRRFQDLDRRFDEDRTLMLVVEDRGSILGGALAFRRGAVTVRMIGLDARVRGKGLGRRLMETIELEAMRLGAGGINLGASAEAKGFYVRLGYAGRGVMMHKGLPLPGRFLEARLRNLRDSAAGSGGAGAAFLR